MSGTKIRTRIVAGVLALLLAVAASFIAAELATPAPADASPDSAADTRASLLPEGTETHEEPLPTGLDLRHVFGDLIPVQVFS